jgi:ferredoxin
MAKYTIRINRAKCVGDKLCCEEAPNTFRVDDDKVIVTDPEGDPPENILAAAKSCLLNVIILHDAQTGEQVWPEEPVEVEEEHA